MLTIYINYTTEYGEAPSQVSVSIENETGFTFTEEYLPELTADGYQFDGWMLDDRLVRTGDISNIISIDTTFNLVAHWTQERNYWGNATGGFGFPKTYIITDSDGNEFTGVYVESETIFTATDNDVREGKVYASDSGVSTGSKNIPAYHTNAGKRLILPNSNFVIPLSEDNAYDYTALQCIISLADPDNFDNSVNTDRIVLNHSVFQVNSSVKLADVIKDSDALSIDLNITNDSDNYYFIHYFTYKEEY